MYYYHLTKWIFFYHVYLIETALGQLGEPLYTFAACHGITLDSFVTPQCNSTSRILPVRVMAAAKANSSGCPLIAEDMSVTATCCVYDPGDCTGEYAVLNNPSASGVFHEECIGLESCPRGKQAATMDTWYLNCTSTDVFLERTNYMYMEYHCIPASRIGTIPLVHVQATNQPVYLLGQTYPSPISNTTANCTVQSDDCDASITMYIVDFRLANDSIGCAQTLNVSGKLLTCADDNNFEIFPVMRTTKNYMTINFNSSVTNEGFFWVGFLSTSTSGVLTLSCPTQEPVCETKKSTSDNSRDESALENEGLSAGALAGIIVSAILFSAIVVLIVVVIVRKKLKRKKQGSTSENINMSYLIPGKLPPKQNQLPPISTSLPTNRQTK